MLASYLLLNELFNFTEEESIAHVTDNNLSRVDHPNLVLKPYLKHICVKCNSPSSGFRTYVDDIRYVYLALPTTPFSTIELRYISCTRSHGTPGHQREPAAGGGAGGQPGPLDKLATMIGVQGRTVTVPGALGVQEQQLPYIYIMIAAVVVSGYTST